MTEHSEPDHRNELFAIQFAIQNVTNIIAAVLGAVVATFIAGWLGLDSDGPATYRIILVHHGRAHGGRPADRGAARRRPPEPGLQPRLRAAGEPAAFPSDPRRSRARMGIVVRDRDAVRPPADPRVPDLDRRRSGHPVPQPVHPAEVRPRPDGAQRRLRADQPRDGRSRSSPSRASPGGSDRSPPSSSSRARASRSSSCSGSPPCSGR